MFAFQCQNENEFINVLNVKMNIQVSGLFDSVMNRLSYATLLDTGQWINPLPQSFFTKGS